MNCNMKIHHFIFALLVVVASGCASIVSRSTYHIPVRSNVDGTLVTVRDRRGTVCATARTPAIVTLKSGNGFFTSGLYTFTFEKDGYSGEVQKRQARLDGWYFGNLIFGGIPGMLIIDPITGAMFTLDEHPINGNLVYNRSLSSPKTEQQTKKTTVTSAPTVTEQPPVLLSPLSVIPEKSESPIKSPEKQSPPAVKATAASPAMPPPRAATPIPSLSGTVEKLKQLRDSGAITQEEYEDLVLRTVQKNGKE